jgi:protein-disulfide isomerase
MATTTEKPAKKTPPASQKQSIKERRAAQKQRQQRQQQILLTIVAVALLVGVILMVFISTRPAEAYMPPEVPARYKDFAAQKLMGVTPDGYPYLGAENAPTTLEEIGSFSCIVCQQYHKDVFVNLLDKFKSGQAKFVYIPVTTTGEFNPDGATRGALCAAQQGKFWEMHDILFDWQTRYGSGANDAGRLTTAAGALGMDTGQFSACLNSQAVKDLIAKAQAEADKRGMTGTPTVFLDGKQIQPVPQDQHVPTLAELRGLIEAKAAAR